MNSIVEEALHIISHSRNDSYGSAAVNLGRIAKLWGAYLGAEITVYGTGSTESDTRYASVGLASSAIPSQRLHFVNPEAGRVTAQYQVWLDE